MQTRFLPLVWRDGKWQAVIIQGQRLSCETPEEAESLARSRSNFDEPTSWATVTFPDSYKSKRRRKR